MKKPRAWLWGLALLLIPFAARLHPQSDGGLQTTTVERLETEPWWPTKATVPLNGFAGSAQCTACHRDEMAETKPSAMQRAASIASASHFLGSAGSAQVTVASLSYSVRAADGGFEYAVTAGNRRDSQRLDWVMGAGEMGDTFLYKVDGRWFQSMATFYAEKSQLDITTGLEREDGSDLAAALGKQLSGEDARKCFGCHTVHATTMSGFEPLHAEAGLGCEACHGPAAGHVAAARPGGSTGLLKETVFNPAKLSPADSIDFCGACHRSTGDVSAFLTPQIASSTAVVRFQPYRLEESRCWRTTRDERLTCVACHDPHQRLERKASSYDGKCLRCHAAGAAKGAADHAGKVCPKAVQGCVSCHMPKVRVASMHADFTDHFIRVVQAGEGVRR
jgi:hypothetical protein